MLFYYENEHSVRPIGVIFLEGCYCERLLTPPACKEESIEKIVSITRPAKCEDNQTFPLYP